MSLLKQSPQYSFMQFILVITSFLLFTWRDNLISCIQLFPETDDPAWTLTHVVSSYGPQSPNVTYAQLILAEPWTLCNNSVMDNVNNWKPARSNNIPVVLLAVRGDCPFINKTMSAQSAGAVGLIVTNNIYNIDLIPMGPLSVNDYTITIPSVFMSRFRYEKVLLPILRDHGLYPIVNNNLNATVLTVAIDHRGDFPPPEWPSDNFRTTALLMLVLPGLWIVLALCYVIRKWCAAKVDKSQRENVARHIPIVQYYKPDVSVRTQRLNQQEQKQNPITSNNNNNTEGIADNEIEPEELSPAISPASIKLATNLNNINAPPNNTNNTNNTNRNKKISSKKRPKIHNTSCAICLEDFEDAERVKLLYCGHAYHVQCIDVWMVKSPLCPTCRISVMDYIPPQNRCLSCLCCISRSEWSSDNNARNQNNNRNNNNNEAGQEMDHYHHEEHDNNNDDNNDSNDNPNSVESGAIHLVPINVDSDRGSMIVVASNNNNDNTNTNNNNTNNNSNNTNATNSTPAIQV